MTVRRACKRAKKAAVDISARFLLPLSRHFLNAKTRRPIRMLVSALQQRHSHETLAASISKSYAAEPYTPSQTVSCITLNSRPVEHPSSSRGSVPKTKREQQRDRGARLRRVMHSTR